MILEVLALVFGVASPLAQQVVDSKDTRYSKSRIWKRARWLPGLLSVLAVITLFIVNWTERAARQKQMGRIETNVEALVAQGTLSREDANRIFGPGGSATQVQAVQGAPNATIVQGGPGSVFNINKAKSWWESCFENLQPKPTDPARRADAEQIRKRIYDKLERERGTADAVFFNTPRMNEPFPPNSTLRYAPRGSRSSNSDTGSID